MAAPGGLEQWQKDGFFQAAEEVQESADLMESIYRTWMRERTNGSSSEDLIDLQRELQTALGTAKWQKFNGLTDRSRSYLSSWKDSSRTSGRMGGLHIQGQQQNIQFGHSIRITLLLMLSIFLIVPFLVSST